MCSMEGLSGTNTLLLLLLLLNGYIILKEKLLLEELTLANFCFVDFRR